MCCLNRHAKLALFWHASTCRVRCPQSFAFAFALSRLAASAVCQDAHHLVLPQSSLAPGRRRPSVVAASMSRGQRLRSGRRRAGAGAGRLRCAGSGMSVGAKWGGFMWFRWNPEGCSDAHPWLSELPFSEPLSGWTCPELDLWKNPPQVGAHGNPRSVHPKPLVGRGKHLTPEGQDRRCGRTRVHGTIRLGRSVGVDPAVGNVPVEPVPW